MRTRVVIVALLVGIFGLNACKNPAPTENQISTERQVGARGGRLVVRDRGAPKTFNFLHAGDSGSATIALYLLQSHLAEFDHDTQKFVPGLAESWEASSEGKTITVKLREGLKFSDGTPLTTDDVIFTYKVAADKNSGSLFVNNYLVDDKPITFTKIDDRTVKMDLPRAVASIESFFAVFGVLPRHKLQVTYDKGEFGNAWKTNAAPADLAVTGAFTLKEYVEGQRTILARNPNYWKKDKAGNALPYLDELVIEAIPDANNSLLKFQQGEIDLLDNIAAANFATLKQQPPANAIVKDFGASMVTDFLWFNLNDGKDAAGQSYVAANRHEWFSDVRFRRAIAMAIDRGTIIQNVLRGLGAPLYGLVSPANQQWTGGDVTKYEFDLAKAKALLQEAGFNLRDNTLVDKTGQSVEFTLVVDETVAERKAMATIIQEDLAKLGIKVNVAPLDKNAFMEMIGKKLTYDAAIHGFAPTDTDPSTLITGLKIGGGQRYWFMGEKQAKADWEKSFDTLAQGVETAVNATERKQKFEAAQKLLSEQLPMTPLVVRNFASGAKANLGNYRPSVVLPRSLWNADELFWKK